jgi:hypothetical protein
MSEQSLYDADILLWSEQQAEVIRRLGRTRRDVSNELDVENVAEEIESVGRSELAAVKSCIRLILLHLMKLFAEADSEAARHWRSEIVAFHSEMLDRYAPSMRQRIDVDEIWSSARHQSMLASEEPRQRLLTTLPADSPFALEDLLADRLEVASLVQRVAGGGEDES